MRILEDEDTVRRLQEGHGPWNDTVSRVCKSPLHTSPTHSVFFSPLSTQSLPPHPSQTSPLNSLEEEDPQYVEDDDLISPYQLTTPNDITTYPTPSLLIQPPLVSTPTPCTTVQLPNHTRSQSHNHAWTFNHMEMLACFSFTNSLGLSLLHFKKNYFDLNFICKAVGAFFPKRSGFFSRGDRIRGEGKPRNTVIFRYFGKLAWKHSRFSAGTSRGAVVILGYRWTVEWNISFFMAVIRILRTVVGDLLYYECIKHYKIR